MAPFTFREFDVPNALRVELRDDDAPYGRPEEIVAFETGGETVLKRVKFAGRREPLYHALHADDRPLVVKGAFRDYRMGRGHAKAMRALIERIRGRANLLRITWGGEQWTGPLRETLFGHEGDGHVTYELTFDIALPPGATDARAPSTPRGDADAVSRVRAKLLAKPKAPPHAAAFADLVLRDFGALDEGLAQLEDTVRAVDVARGNVARQARRVTSLNARVQQVAAALTRTLRATTAQTAGVVRGTADVVRWNVYSAELFEVLRATRATARAAAESARARARSTSTLYRVRPGDTLESIARAELGDAGRVEELGIPPSALVPGRILRLPPATPRS